MDADMGAEGLRSLPVLHSSHVDQGGHWASQLQSQALHTHTVLYTRTPSPSWNIHDLERLIAGLSSHAESIYSSYIKIKLISWLSVEYLPYIQR